MGLGREDESHPTRQGSVAESPAGFLVCHKGCEVHAYIRLLCSS